MRRKFVLASPCSPCGATWLINCLLELGVYTYRLHDLKDSQKMWVKQGAYSILTEREEILKLWLPVLSRKEAFTFREDVEVEWTHEYPRNHYSTDKVILFVRDPRNALHSFYNRISPALSYREFVHSPDRRTLLDKIEDYGWFCRTWLLKSNGLFFRFEDYKKDAFVLLKDILKYMELEYSDKEILKAVEESTYEKGREAETRYRAEKGGDLGAPQSLHNSGASSTNVVTLENDKSQVSLAIEERLQDLLISFGYAQDQSRQKSPGFDCFVDYSNLVRYFDDLDLQQSLVSPREKERLNHLVASTVRISEICDEEYISNLGLADWEAQQLVENLLEFISRLSSSNMILEEAPTS